MFCFFVFSKLKNISCTKVPEVIKNMIGAQTLEIAEVEIRVPIVFYLKRLHDSLILRLRSQSRSNQVPATNCKVENVLAKCLLGDYSGKALWG